MSPYCVAVSRFVAVDADRAFAELLVTPLPTIFTTRYAALPAIREVRDQEGVWGTVGQTRTLVLADGGTLRETLSSVDRPRSFGYVLDEIRGPLRPLVRSVDGVWSVTPEGTGARIGWAWTLHPRVAAAGLVMPVFGRMWRGYADRALRRIEALLLA